MKTFTITSFIKPHGPNKGFRRSINLFLALFISILFSNNAISQAIDFQQAQNGDPTAFPITFTNGILNSEHTTFYEGMGIPQRMIFTGLTPTGANKYSVYFEFLAGLPNKDVHAFDMLMSWEQAVQTAIKYGGEIVGTGTVNELANLFSASCQNAPAECAALSTSAHSIRVPILNTPVAATGFYSGVDENITCFEGLFGPRDMEIRGNAPITSALLTFLGYTGNYAKFRLDWVSTSTNIMIRYASRAALGDGPCGYGPNHGAGAISGGNYHNIFERLVKNDGNSNEIKGSRDNQLMSGAITVVPPPNCPQISAQSVCATATSIVYTVPSPEAGTTYNWTLTNGTPSAGAQLQDAVGGVFTGTTVTVVPTATNFTGGTFSLNLTMVKTGVPNVNCPQFTDIGTVVAVSASASASPAGNVSVTASIPHYQLHATVNGIEDNPAFSYSWSQNPTTGGSLSATNIPNPTFSATVAGTYEWTVTATQIASPNCTATASVSRTIDAGAGCPTVSTPSICQQTTNTYQASVGPVAGETWTWSVNNGASIVAVADGGIANGGQSIKVLAGTQNFTLTLTKDFDNPDLPDQVCPYNVTVVATPSVVTHYNPPACTDKSFSVDVISPTAGYTYTIDQPDNSRTFDAVTPGNTNNFSFSGLTLGDGFIVTVTTTGPGCTASSSCTNPSPGSSRIATNQENTEPAKTIKDKVAETYKIVLESGTKVNAVPNPFREKIRFNLVSTVSGMGSLELYNMTGQRVAVVYQGYVQAGREVIKEYVVSSEKRGTLIYVFKVGDQKVTGKLVGLK